MENKRKLQIIESVSLHLSALLDQKDLNEPGLQTEIGKLLNGPFYELAKRYTGCVNLVSESFNQNSNE